MASKNFKIVRLLKVPAIQIKEHTNDTPVLLKQPPVSHYTSVYKEEYEFAALARLTSLRIFFTWIF